MADGKWGQNTVHDKVRAGYKRSKPKSSHAVPHARCVAS